MINSKVMFAEQFHLQVDARWLSFFHIYKVNMTD